MKTIRMIAVMAVFFTAFAYRANAQKGLWKLDLNYNYSLPLGSFKNDIINKGSAAGAMGSVQYFINNKLAVGLGAGYQNYSQTYPRTLYALSKTQTVSAVRSEQVEMTPIIAKATFMPMADKGFIQPYITAGAGAAFVMYGEYLGEFTSIQKTSGSFTAQAGAGVLVPFGKLSESGFRLGADYSFTPYKQFGYSNLNALNFHAGLYFPLR